ncbi:acetate/propionate family kinase [Cognatishimia sp. MH4019]|uniref:acetate/propionate family kinase n=1 Tax=Cognatishimia sp. MH4019 TaxID=2854030 RepID=UPI001CD4CA02|nr:acetate/propionate family kinase [Cognatishimia sp. MH4019]
MRADTFQTASAPAAATGRKTGILTLNAGSSSLKFGLYGNVAEPEMLLHGQVDGIGARALLEIETTVRKSKTPVTAPTHAIALEAVMAALSPHIDGLNITGVGHRIVHGGPDLVAPQVLTPDVLARLESLAPLAPLHQPPNLAGVAAAQKMFPEAVQIGCFDTAFHRDHPWVNDTFALPRSYYAEGIRRYGFHGLSYDYVTGVIARDYPELHAGKIIIAHLGNGASMCAIRQGMSVGSTMGFSALDGLPMGTRCGQIDPGVILYLIKQKGMAPQEVHELLYEQSGLLGLSNISSDMRTLLADKRPQAAEAIDYYVFRARREIGALSAVLSGVDAIIFCGGIGENAAPIRQRICEGLEYLGISVSSEANAANAREIGTGATRVMIIPTDEERIIARAVHHALSA